jgi:hypothetical protein
MLVMQVLSTDIPLISLVTILSNSVVSTLLNWHKCENVQNMLRFLYTSCFPNQRTSDTSNLTCKYLTVGNWPKFQLDLSFPTGVHSTSDRKTHSN